MIYGEKITEVDPKLRNQQNKFWNFKWVKNDFLQEEKRVYCKQQNSSRFL